MKELTYETIYMSRQDQEMGHKINKEFLLAISDIEFRKNDPDEDLSNYNYKLKESWFRNRHRLISLVNKLALFLTKYEQNMNGRDITDLPPNVIVLQANNMNQSINLSKILDFISIMEDLCNIQESISKMHNNDIGLSISQLDKKIIQGCTRLKVYLNS